MGDENVPEVFMMMRYPACLGGLGEGELDRVFGAIRQKPGLSDKVCTFGASITGSTCPMVPVQPLPTVVPSTVPNYHVSTLVSKYESLDGATQPSGSLARPSRVEGMASETNGSPRHPSSSSSLDSPSSASSSGSSDITKGFYCKTAPPYTAETGIQRINSTIVVEMYTRLIKIGCDNNFFHVACKSITEAIQEQILSQRSLKLSVHFLILEPDRVFTYPFSSGVQQQQ